MIHLIHSYANVEGILFVCLFFSPLISINSCDIFKGLKVLICFSIGENQNPNNSKRKNSVMHCDSNGRNPFNSNDVTVVSFDNFFFSLYFIAQLVDFDLGI